MKMPIIWHENGLKNLQKHLAEKEATAVRAQEEVFRLKTLVLKLEYQIAEAKRRGIDGFDEVRFLQRRASHATS